MHSNNGLVVWFTGLSGAGKTTIATALRGRLRAQGAQSVVLDGDDLRRGLNSDLGFSTEARTENVRRIAEVARCLADQGAVVLVAVIAPTTAMRAMAERLCGAERFVEVFVRCSLATCEARDVKGHYRAARGGMLKGFTGVDDAYEEPAAPDWILDTEAASVDGCVMSIHSVVQTRTGCSTESA